MNTITSFLPSSGIAGAVVTITASGFSPWTIVNFGTVQTTILSNNGTVIKASVPSSVNPAAMKLSVISSGQTVVSTDNFRD